MKTSFVILSLLLATLPCQAAYRLWTNSEGQTAALDLYDIKEEGGEKVGLFRMKNGKTVRLKASQLSEADAKILAVWKPSVFEDMLKDNMVILRNGKLEPYRDHKTPLKYYIFYYTASWCPPCRAFTPALVEWYNQNKNENFELVLITSDGEKSDMLEYAREKKMPWPQVEFTKAPQFKKEFNHGVSGIPSLIVCDLQGKVLGNFRSQLPELTTMVGN